MIAARSLTTMFSEGRTSALDAPVAGLAGLSVAFLAFAAPADALSQLVSLTGLPDWLPAAQPPLGTKARIGLGGLAGLITFAAAFLLLKWLERIGRPRSKAAVTDEADAGDPPRLRRRDLHPDAPSRAPLLARELGAIPNPPRPPQPLSDPEPLNFERPDVASEPAPLPRKQKRPIILSEPGDIDAALHDLPPVLDPSQTMSGGESHLSSGAHPEPIVPASWLSTPAEPEEEDELASIGRNPGAPEPIDALLVRLERGLARRRSSGPGTPIADPVVPDIADDRLQNAIASLQRFTSRAD